MFGKKDLFSSISEIQWRRQIDFKRQTYAKEELSLSRIKKEECKGIWAGLILENF